MLSEALIRVGTVRELAAAGEQADVMNSVFDTDAGNAITLSQRPYFDRLHQTHYITDMVWDNGGDDIVSGGPGNDWFIAGAGSDTYVGGDHFDMIAYVLSAGAVKVDLANSNGSSAFRDTNPGSLAFGDRLIDVEGVVGSKFGDTLRGFSDSRSSYLNGYDGNDMLTGGLGADTLKGGNGNDTINAIGGHGDEVFGGAGTDRITIGSNSTISGGSESDLFIFNASHFLGAGGEPLGEIVITDWNVGGQRDSLQIQGLTSPPRMHIEQDGADLTISFDGVNGEIRFLDTTAQELMQSLSLG